MTFENIIEEARIDDFPPESEARESPDGDSGTETSPQQDPKNQSNISKKNIVTHKGAHDSIVIIEAPEEFRTTSSDRPETPPPPNAPNHDNPSTLKIPETGDTFRQAQSESNANIELSSNSCDKVDNMSVVDSSCANAASIEIDARVHGAPASGCSRLTTAKVRVAPQITSKNDPSEIVSSREAISWRFANGRLVFDVVADDDDDSISSKRLNRKIGDTSRLGRIEAKLKEAGITDVSEEQVVDHHKNFYDANQNLLLRSDEEISLEEIIPEVEGNNVSASCTLCEFDVRQVATGSPYVYDELDEDDSLYVLKPSDARMGIETERVKHNPDRDNLRSLLKRQGKARRSNRVVFNENKNEFFDADYIILIREECDYDEDDDDGVCTCNQHEMVRLTCCEPNCNCSVYEGYGGEEDGAQPTPQSPKFAPPIEFVDAVTLSPPEGYKDMGLEEQQLLALQQMTRRNNVTSRTAVCRECSVTHEEEDEDEDASQSETEACGDQDEDQEEKEKTDQSQQTTPTTPPSIGDTSNYLDNITMTTAAEQGDVEDERGPPPGRGSPINGILKGGRLWKQQSLEVSSKSPEPQLSNDQIVSDDEGNSRRSVRFIESDQNRDSCDGASDNTDPSDDKELENLSKELETKPSSTISPDATEMMLTFKLGNHVLISNNSLKPNSAVRQLFPCTKPLNSDGGGGDEGQYLVTAESLRAFEEAKRAKLPQIIQSGETDESIKRAIERNTLRRSLIRYEPRSKKSVQKADNSLVERIKQLTCDVDEVAGSGGEEVRVSPPGEEASKVDKSFSPSSSSTSSSNSSSVSATYRKITDLFGNKREKETDAKTPQLLPDLGNGLALDNGVDARKQFLTSTLMTACVGSGLASTTDYYQMGRERGSMASSVGTEYSLEDIDEGLKTAGVNNGEKDDGGKKIAPDVLAGTPSASESGDELAMFVQQDAGRIERIKKKYQPEPSSNKDEDDEHDDYGFNRRPSVRGIKPRFGSTTEILQQIQKQMQPPPPSRAAWPYYSESGLTTTHVDPTETAAPPPKTRNINQTNLPLNYPYAQGLDETKARLQYRPTSLQDENLYQNCSNHQQRCVYRVNGNQVNQQQSYAKVDYYQSLPRLRNTRPLSPPPLELAKNYHQTMVYIPYNHIEGYHQPPPPASYYQSSDYMRVSNQNQINKRYIEPIYQQRIHLEEHHHYNSQVMAPLPLKTRVPITSRSESPVSGQFATVQRSTQTAYYQPRYHHRPIWPPPQQQQAAKSQRHSYPAGMRYPPDNVSLTDTSSDSSGVGFSKDSPTKQRFLERGVPEGAAASGPLHDSAGNSQSSSSTMTSPTSPPNGSGGGGSKPVFYAMNV